LRGLQTDSAVLCTKDATFDVKVAETSNTLLLLQHLSVADELPSVADDSKQIIISQKITAKKHEYFELKRIKPGMSRLKELLEECLYKGPAFEEEDNSATHLYSFEDLLEQVQASEAELLEGLRNLKACLIQGQWRLLDFDYTVSVLFSIVAAVNEQSWDLHSIPRLSLCHLLQDMYPVEVIVHVLSSFSTPVNQSEDVTSDNERHRLNEDAVCRLCAELVLHSSVEFNLSEFEETWKATVPEGMTTNYEQLKGLAMIQRDVRPEVIQYFPASELPDNTEERFSVLFKKREKWTLEDITPYIQDLSSDKLGIGALLTKFSRVSNNKGIKLYSSRNSSTFK